MNSIPPSVTLRPASLRTKGFTLIELLAVIAIVGVLVALAMAVAQNMLVSAKEVQCLNNLRQIGSAMFVYATDNDSQLPPVREGINSGDVWQQVLVKNNYIAQKSLFCPVATQTGRGWNATEPDYAASARTSGNNALTGTRVGVLGDANSPRRLAAIKNPSKALLVSDACAPARNVFKGTWSLDLRWFLKPTSTISQSNVAPRHRIKNNDMLSGSFGAVFADGHAEMMKWNDPRFQDTEFLRQFLHAE